MDKVNNPEIDAYVRGKDNKPSKVESKKNPVGSFWVTENGQKRDFTPRMFNRDVESPSGQVFIEYNGGAEKNEGAVLGDILCVQLSPPIVDGTYSAKKGTFFTYFLGSTGDPTDVYFGDDATLTLKNVRTSNIPDSPSLEGHLTGTFAMGVNRKKIDASFSFTFPGIPLP